MNNIASRIIGLKESLQEEKEKQAMLTGRMSNYMEELEKNHSCLSIEQAQEKINQLGIALENTQKELQYMLSSFEEKYKL